MTTPVPLRPKSDDLWELAVTKVPDNLRRKIDFSGPEKLSALRELHSLTEKSRQQCIEKRWRYTRKSGEVIIFRDLFDKISTWIDLFKQVGDNAMQYDPAHAALPWAGVRFLLQIAVNDTAKFKFAVESAATIAETICRYHIFEHLYLRSNSSASEELEKALVQLYIAILSYLANVKDYFDQNTAKRILKSGFLSESDLSHSFDLIEIHQVAVDRCAGLVGIQYHIDSHNELKGLLEKMDGPLNRMNDNLKNIQDALTEAKRAKILRWISSEPYAQYHEQAKKDALPGTGQWLLSDPTFQKWKRDSVSSIIWLHGIPGSGKSKLVSIVIEDAMKESNNGYSRFPAFFYCSRNPAEPARSNPEAILASIVRQLSNLEPGHPLLDPVLGSYREEERKGFPSGTLCIEASRALILQLIERYPLTTIILDALDECDPEKRSDMLEELERILQDSSNLVKIFISSRDDQDIVFRLKCYPNLEIASNRNGDDISRFVKNEVQELCRKRKLLQYSDNKKELEELIIAKVTEGAVGMFRWASMQLQYLCVMKTDEDIRDRLGSLPPKLETLYSEVYEQLRSTQLGEGQRHITKNVLSWLLCAQTKLKLDQFLMLASITPKNRYEKLSKDQILDMCCNLVVFDAALNVFRFAHLSVREFFEKRPEYQRTAVNALAAEICLLGLINIAKSLVAKRYLDEMAFVRIDSSLLQDTLGNYLKNYWVIHCKLASGQRADGVLKNLLGCFLEDQNPESALLNWIGCLDLTSRVQGRHSRMRNALTKNRQLDCGTDSSRIPLYVACAFGFPEVVQNLTAKEIIQANFQIHKFSKAVDIALDCGSTEVLKVLMAKNLVHVTEYRIKRLAKRPSRISKKLMRLLLEHFGQEIKITEEVIKLVAHKQDNQEMMSFLLEQRGQEITITNEVLKAAVSNTNGWGIVRLLLERRGEEIKINEEVLKVAMSNLHQGREIVALLLEKRGQDIKINEEVLKAAMSNLHQGREIVALLLEKRGQDIKINEEVLKAAMSNLHQGREIVALLLEQRGQDIKITEEVFKAAVEVGNGDNNIAKLLLEQRGQEIRITAPVIKEAVYRCENAVLQLLEPYGQELDMTEEGFKIIAQSCGQKVVSLLIEQHGQKLKLTKEVIEATLQNNRNGKEVVLLLLNNWSLRHSYKTQMIDLSNEDRVAILREAILLNHKPIVEQLIRNGMNINIMIGNTDTALHLAVCKGHDTMVEMLLNKGALTNTTDSHGWKPYHIAFASNNHLICRMLSDYGCETRGPGTSVGFTPNRLNKAATSSDLSMKILEDGCTLTTAFARYKPRLHLRASLYSRSCFQAQANHPIPTVDRLFYFEVMVLKGNAKIEICIGICKDKVQIGLGWNGDSWGYNESDDLSKNCVSDDSWVYHGANGKVSGGIWNGNAYGPDYGTTGDTIGCGTHLGTGCVFFTKNGKNLGTAFTDVKGRLFPFIEICRTHETVVEILRYRRICEYHGNRDPDVRVSINFGQSEFVYKDTLANAHQN